MTQYVQRHRQKSHSVNSMQPTLLIIGPAVQNAQNEEPETLKPY